MTRQPRRDSAVEDAVRYLDTADLQIRALNSELSKTQVDPVAKADRLESVLFAITMLSNTLQNKRLGRYQNENHIDKAEALLTEVTGASNSNTVTGASIGEWSVTIRKLRESFLRHVLKFLPQVLTEMRAVLFGNVTGSCLAFDIVSSRDQPDIKAREKLYELTDEVGHRYNALEISDEGDCRTFGFIGDDHELRAVLAGVTIIMNLDLLPERSKHEAPKLRMAAWSGLFEAASQGPKVEGAPVVKAKDLIGRKRICHPSVIAISSDIHGRLVDLRSFVAPWFARYVQEEPFGRVFLSRSLRWGLPEPIHKQHEAISGHKKRRRLVRFFSGPHIYCAICAAAANSENLEVQLVDVSIGGALVIALACLQASAASGRVAITFQNKVAGSPEIVRSAHVERQSEFVDKKENKTKWQIAVAFDPVLTNDDLDQILDWESQ